MINPQWLELSMSRTNFNGPKDVRAIEVRLYRGAISVKIVLSLSEKGTSLSNEFAPLWNVLFPI